MTFSPIFLRETDSTNTYCKMLAAENAPHGTAVIACRQTAGRGRLGRRFESPEGAGLYCSVLLREGFKAENVGLITPCAAVAAAKAIDRISGADSGIKWVNDIFLGGRKVCGILTEARLPDYIIIGIGINLLSVKESLPAELHSVASSIEDETGRRFTPKEMADVLLPFLAEELEHMESGAFLHEYRERSVIIGKDAEVHEGNRVYPVHVLGIDDDGKLVVETPDGVRTLHSGDVSVRFE